jgi:hypothetical protein
MRACGAESSSLLMKPEAQPGRGHNNIKINPVFRGMSGNSGF